MNRKGELFVCGEEPDEGSRLKDRMGSKHY
jgi:hypothetical protein